MRLEFHAFTHQSNQTDKIQDSVIASGLITAPAWSAWLSEINGFLTTVSLVIGVAIGLHRLWRIFNKPPEDKGPQSPPPSPL